LRMNHIAHLPEYLSSMTLSETRFPLFGIMLRHLTPRHP